MIVRKDNLFTDKETRGTLFLLQTLLQTKNFKQQNTYS